MSVKKKEEKIELQGKVTQCLPNANFKVSLDKGMEINAYISGKMRRHYIRILVGDSVRVEMSLYDLSKGRIIHRISSRKADLITDKDSKGSAKEED